jgi:hypothetical protein
MTNVKTGTVDEDLAPVRPIAASLRVVAIGVESRANRREPIVKMEVLAELPARDAQVVALVGLAVVE